jgi:hypothetical protein
MPLDEGGGAVVGGYKPQTNAMIKTDYKSGSFQKELGAGVGGCGLGQAQGVLSEDLDALEMGAVLGIWDPVLMAILAGEI